VPYAAAAVFAFFPSLGWEEMFLLLVIGLLLYGRNLPEAGRNLGKVLAQLKRGFDDFKQQLNRDADLREMKDSLKDAARDLRKVADIPRTIAHPVQAAMAKAKDAVKAPPPDELPPPAEVVSEAQPPATIEPPTPSEPPA
jgi:sec-independent protein translocase protein TatA